MPHDYLRDTLVLSYNECKFCGNRTQFACVRCGYCYSCHWKKEELEKDRFESSIMTSSAFGNCSQSTLVGIRQSHHHRLHQQQQQQTKIIDVFGQKAEPICNYHTCHHKFSLHGLGTRVCKCNHPQNHTIGVPILLSS
jgi:hypothetical protein